MATASITPTNGTALAAPLATKKPAAKETSEVRFEMIEGRVYAHGSTGHLYRVLLADGSGQRDFCECKGFYFRGYCRHLTAARKAALEHAGRQQVQITIAVPRGIAGDADALEIALDAAFEYAFGEGEYQLIQYN